MTGLGWCLLGSVLPLCAALFLLVLDDYGHGMVYVTFSRMQIVCISFHQLLGKRRSVRSACTDFVFLNKHFHTSIEYDKEEIGEEVVGKLNTAHQ